jgi:hypothetical protein
MNHHRTTRTRSHKLRRGSVYIAVLGAAMIVSIVSLSAMEITRLQRKSTLGVNDTTEARLMAQSAIEYALAQITADSDWRTTFESGHPYPADWVSLGGSGEFKFDLTDTDGRLDDDENDAVTLQGIGQSGEAMQMATVMLEPTGDPLSCLEVSLCVNGEVAPDAWGAMKTYQIISSNDEIRADISPISGDVEAVNSIGGDITGNVTEGIPPREMPREHVFDYYLHNGTWIDAQALLDEEWDELWIYGVVLSPNENPFGATNPAGIYVIDCQGKDLYIWESRIVGTIVLLNPGPETTIGWGAVVMEPAVPNLPSILVQGDLIVRMQDDDLYESDVGANLNPVGTPYRLVEDSDQSDSHASVVRGLVYVSGTLSLLGDSSHHCRFKGVVVCEEIVVYSQATFKYDPVFFNYPPPGFAQGPEWRVMPGSWQRTSR